MLRASDRIHRVPRMWSNSELRRFANLFAGDVVNVSAWRDEDKEGRFYRDYFTRAHSYAITNFKAEMRGLQGIDGELFLDLAEDLPSNLIERYDVVFNHTCLEHIFDAKRALANLCKMTRDIVILVVPFLQPMHSDYGDYWRFSPQCVAELFLHEGMDVLYLSFNNHSNTAVYVFCVASKRKERWSALFPYPVSYVDPDASGLPEPFAGAFALYGTGLRQRAKRLLRRSFVRLIPHS